MTFTERVVSGKVLLSWYIEQIFRKDAKFHSNVCEVL